MNKLVTPEIKQLLFDKGWRYELSEIYDPEIGGTRVMHSLGEQRWNEGDLSYVDITISEVVMWLYEKHGLFIHLSYVCWSHLNKHAFTPHIAKILSNNGSSDAVRIMLGNENSPTEAYEAAIEYTLNNLI